MSNTIAICLYSKYSQRCKEFMDEMGDDLDVQMVSIDNKNIRETIIRDNQGYHVKTVPCMFLLFPNGRLEKYEGSDAFVWLRKVKEALAKENSSLENQDPQPSSFIPPRPVQEEEEDNKPVNAKVVQMMDSQTQMREQGTESFITKKVENIKDLAQAMQRQRESEEEAINNPPSQPSLPIQRP